MAAGIRRVGAVSLHSRTSANLRSNASSSVPENWHYRSAGLRGRRRLATRYERQHYVRPTVQLPPASLQGTICPREVPRLIHDATAVIVGHPKAASLLESRKPRH